MRFTDVDVRYAHAQTGVYAAYQPVTLGGMSLGVYEGRNSVEARVGGRTYRLVVTHLAGQEVQDIQLAQTRELPALLLPSPSGSGGAGAGLDTWPPAGGPLPQAARGG